MAPPRHAWITLATNDVYCMGALVTGNSLRRVNTEAELVVLITNEVSEDMRVLLEEVFDHIKNVDIVKGGDHELVLETDRPEWGVCMTKILAWRLTEYAKMVYIDSDAIVVKNADELFKCPELSACSDIGWTDIFNSGVFVFEPNEQTYKELFELTVKNVSFDRADQGLLNVHFSNWFNEKEKHLSVIYNCGTLGAYSYKNAWDRFGDKVKIIHFLGGLKPWEYGYNPVTKEVTQPPGTRPTQLQEHLQLWWSLFLEKSGLVGKLACFDLSEKAGHELVGVSGLNKKQTTSHFSRTHFPYVNPEKSIGG